MFTLNDKIKIFITGIITLTNLHKLTETKAHTLNVSVSDGIYTSFARVRVEMISANKYSPVFDKHQYEAKISENLPSGTRVCKVHAVDKDNGNYGTPSYYISSQVLLEKFMIDNFTGMFIILMIFFYAIMEVFQPLDRLLAAQYFISFFVGIVTLI